MILEFFAEQLFFQKFYWMLSKVYLNERKYKCVRWKLKKSSGCGARTSKIET